MALRAVYPGSFDPPTVGHIDIVVRAIRLVDELIIGVGINPSKLTPLFTVEERIQMLNESCSHLGNIKVKSFDGLLVDFAKAEGAQAVVRGLRAISDFENEFQMAQMNCRLQPDVETIFMMTNWEHSYLSSSLVRDVAAFGGDITGLVPEPVEELLKLKYSKREAKR